MTRFDYMGFGRDCGSDDMFVVHAGKYTPEQAVSICKSEYEHLFKETGEYRLPWQRRLREPIIDDVLTAGCAFRFGVSPEWPDGCYTLVGINKRGAFPVHVIDFDRLKLPKNVEGERSRDE